MNMESKKLMTVLTIFASVVSVLTNPQDSRRIALDEVYQAYAPGQYALDGQQIVRVAGPRLVPRNGSPVLRAIPASQLKRVRINPNSQQQFIQPQETYAIDTPLTYSQSATRVSAQQEPAYYIQRTPSPVQQQQKPLVRVARPQQLINQNQAVVENDDDGGYAPDLNPQYNFSFDVKDDDLTNYQNRQEERNGNTVKGSYSVVDPDGYVRTVTYTADSINGFQAKVTREPTDVKIKFPVPTEAPEEHGRPIHKSGPSLRTQQFAQYPSTVAQYSQQNPSTYTQQSQLASGAYYTSGQQQPTYVVRRVPASSPRLVKVLRQ